MTDDEGTEVTVEAQPQRIISLSPANTEIVYALGLGIPFVLAGVAYGRALGTFAWVRGHYALVMRTGGGLLVVVGLFMVTGLYAELTTDLQVWISDFETGV